MSRVSASLRDVGAARLEIFWERSSAGSRYTRLQVSVIARGPKQKAKGVCLEAL